MFCFARAFWSSTSPLLPALLLAGSVAVAQTAPTENLTPQEKDRRWQASTDNVAQARERVLQTMDKTIAAGPFRADWQSLATRDTPEWFADAKFGIFIHWGVFSVPGFGNEWYSRNMYQQGSPEFKYHVETYGPQAKFGYKDFIPMFRMEHFDPAAWADLFVRSGAKYVIPVAEHHDGFALYPTALSPWNAVAMGPHRNLVGDLGTAVRGRGLKFGVSLHRAEHDWFFDGGRTFNSDVNDPKYAGFYGPAEARQNEAQDDDLGLDYTFVSNGFRQDWMAHAAELIGEFHPDLLYFDWWVGHPDFRESEEKIAAYFYDQAAQHKQSVVMFKKYVDMANHSGTLDVERGGLNGIQAEPWQTDTTMSHHGWGYLKQDSFKPTSLLLDQLIDVVSKNGNLLLNIGPAPDGTIPEPVQKTLLELGAWLRTNGEGIYGTRPWIRYGEGPTTPKSGSFADAQDPNYTAQDFRFTHRGNIVYAIALRSPGTELVVHALAAGVGTVANVRLLGSSEAVAWQQGGDGLDLRLAKAPASTLPVVFAVELR